MQLDSTFQAKIHKFGWLFSAPPPLSKIFDINFLTVFQTSLIKIALFPQQEGNFYWNTYSFDQNFFHTF